MSEVQIKEMSVLTFLGKTYEIVDAKARERLDGLNMADWMSNLTVEGDNLLWNGEIIATSPNGCIARFG